MPCALRAHACVPPRPPTCLPALTCFPLTLPPAVGEVVSAMVAAVEAGRSELELGLVGASEAPAESLASPSQGGVGAGEADTEAEAETERLEGAPSEPPSAGPSVRTDADGASDWGGGEDEEGEQEETGGGGGQTSREGTPLPTNAVELESQAEQQQGEQQQQQPSPPSAATPHGRAAGAGSDGEGVRSLSRGCSMSLGHAAASEGPDGVSLAGEGGADDGEMEVDGVAEEPEQGHQQQAKQQGMRSREPSLPPTMQQGQEEQQPGAGSPGAAAAAEEGAPPPLAYNGFAAGAAAAAAAEEAAVATAAAQHGGPWAAGGQSPRSGSLPLDAAPEAAAPEGGAQSPPETAAGAADRPQAAEGAQAQASTQAVPLAASESEDAAWVSIFVQLADTPDLPQMPQQQNSSPEPAPALQQREPAAPPPPPQQQQQQGEALQGAGSAAQPGEQQQPVELRQHPQQEQQQQPLQPQPPGSGEEIKRSSRLAQKRQQRGLGGYGDEEGWEEGGWGGLPPRPREAPVAALHGLRQPGAGLCVPVLAGVLGGAAGRGRWAGGGCRRFFSSRAPPERGLQGTLPEEAGPYIGLPIAIRPCSCQLIKLLTRPCPALPAAEARLVAGFPPEVVVQRWVRVWWPDDEEWCVGPAASFGSLSDEMGQQSGAEGGAEGADTS